MAGSARGRCPEAVVKVAAPRAVAPHPERSLPWHQLRMLKIRGTPPQNKKSKADIFRTKRGSMVFRANPRLSLLVPPPPPPPPHKEDHRARTDLLFLTFRILGCCFFAPKLGLEHRFVFVLVLQGGCNSGFHRFRRFARESSHLVKSGILWRSPSQGSCGKSMVSKTG